MINKVILTGRITTDIELRRTNDGIPYTFFTLAVTRRTNRDEADFIRCAAWRGTAEFMNQYLNKGSLVGVEGRLEVYTQQVDGQYDTRTTVQVTQLDSLESRSQVEARTQEQRLNTENTFQQESNTSVNNNQEMTFAEEKTFEQTPITSGAEEKPAESSNTYNDINLDDIKF